MSQNSPQRRALTRMPTAGARSWSGYTSCADGGWIMPCMKGVRTAPPACEAVSLTGSRDGLGAAESGDPCRQSRTSILPVMGLLSPARAVQRTMTNFLPIRKTLRLLLYSNTYWQIHTTTTRADAAGAPRTVPYPSVFSSSSGVRLGWPFGMKPTPIAAANSARQSRAAQIDLDRPAAPRPVLRQLLHKPYRSENSHPVCLRRYTGEPRGA